jgi:sorting nexin-1/2
LDASGRSSISSSVGGKEQAVPIFRVTVTDPTRMGDGLNSFVLYSVTTVTQCPDYRKRARKGDVYENQPQDEQFKVQRRYSDFLALYQELCHANPGVFVPPVPEKHAIGTFLFSIMMMNTT